MKKYLITGLAAVAISGMFTSCTHENDTAGGSSDLGVVETYEKAFISRFGTPSPDADWGFGPNTTNSKATTRSVTTPACPNIDKPYDEEWVATYNETAKEPTQTNTWDNYDNGYWKKGTAATFYWTQNNVVNTLRYNFTNGDAAGNGYTSKENKDFWTEWCQPYNNNDFSKYGANTKDEAILALKAKLDETNRSNWYNYTPATEDTWVPDNTYVTNFKITSTYNGYISVAGSEDIIDNGTLSGAERTIVVTGTWNITEDQRIGSLGKIIIANGGTVNVASGKKLNMVNQARLVVLPGGKLTGQGSVEVNNGNAEGKENYNGGTIDVAVFNNNFGKLYNYGKFLVNEYQGGAQESNFYNHSLVAIDHFAGTANARIFNACQFYVKNNARIRNYEGLAGSALIVDGQLMFSSSEDGTNTPTYVGLAAGALVKANTLYNNGTSWTGPTEGGYAVLSIGKFDYMNWEQDHPENGGYFINNIYLQADDLTNVPDGNGMQQKTDNGTEYYTMSQAKYKFEKIVANAGGNGNGNTKVINKGTTEIIPADEDFEKGVKGCTPGFKGNPPVEEEDFEPVIRVIAEDMGDQSLNEASDFDFNDVVFDVIWVSESKVKIKILAAGGTLPLTVGWDGTEDPNDPKAYIKHEVHYMLGYSESTMINTHSTVGNYKDGVAPYPFEFTGSFRKDHFAEDVRDNIPVKVRKNGVWYDINAEQGRAPGKIAVGTDYNPWCNERVDIDDWWQNNNIQGLFYLYTKSPATLTKFWYKQATYRNGEPISK